MDRVAQVVQQLANDLSLILLLDPIEDGGVGRRARGRETRRRKARFQDPFLRLCSAAGTIASPGEFPDGLKKLP
jgi:hypothetical protein